MRATAATTISAPIETVWGVVSDPERALSFMSGVTRWEVEGEEPTGLGARYRMLLRVGSAEVGGLIEIVEWDPPKELAWTSITGVDQRGRWRLRSAAGGRTKVEIRLAAGVAGAGVWGWLAERVAQPIVTCARRCMSCRGWWSTSGCAARRPSVARRAARTAVRASARSRPPARPRPPRAPRTPSPPRASP
jgi:carbon monoxide dehydrogenase subunit G